MYSREAAHKRKNDSVKAYHPDMVAWLEPVFYEGHSYYVDKYENLFLPEDVRLVSADEFKRLTNHI